jgi:Fe-S cluster biogenesis protein NfuA
MSDRPKKIRRQVRVENPGGACGYVGHMTADELKDRAVGSNVDGTCPICGMVHLTRDEIEELERQKISDSERFEAIKGEAEAEGE